MNTTTAPATTGEAIELVLAAARAAGLTVEPAPANLEHLGPSVHAGHLHLGFHLVAGDVDLVVLNSDAGNRTVRPCGPSAGRVLEAGLAWVASQA